MTTDTEKVLVLRTCRPDMSSYGGFRWPESGPVACPDWSPRPVCGQGLHGLLWGEGDGALLSWAPECRWLVVEVTAADVVELSGKVKFPAGVVVFCGDRLEATTYLSEHGGAGRAIVGGTATAGDGGTATAGVGGTLIIKRWDAKALRYRTRAADVGEDGILPNVAYRLNDTGLFVPVEVTP